MRSVGNDPGSPGKKGASPSPPRGAETAVKGSRTRALLLALLLVLLGGGGFYGYQYFGLSREAVPPAAPVRAIKRRWPIPPKPEPPPTQKIPDTSPVAVEAPAPAPASPVKNAAPAGHPVMEKHPTAPQNPVRVAGPVKKSASTQRPAVPPGAETGSYTLVGGAFLFQPDADQAVKTIRRLGFEPRLTTIRRKEPMTRLRIGTFSPEQARFKLKELASAAPDAFGLRQEGQVTVYAASYFDLRQARRFESRLKGRGIQVTEVPAQVTMPLTLVSFGRFNDFSSAKKVAERAEAIGLDVYIRKSR